MSVGLSSNFDMPQEVASQKSPASPKQVKGAEKAQSSVKDKTKEKSSNFSSFFFETVGGKKEFVLSYKMVVSKAVLQLNSDEYKSSSIVSKIGQQLLHRSKLVLATAGEVVGIAARFFMSVGLKMGRGVAESFYETKAQLFQIGASDSSSAKKTARTFAALAKAPLAMIYKAVKYGVEATLSNVGQALIFTVSGLSGALAGVEKFDTIESRNKERGLGTIAESLLLIVPKWFQALNITKAEVFKSNPKNMMLVNKIGYYAVGIFKGTFKMLGHTVRVGLSPLTAVVARLYSKGIPSIKKDLPGQVDALKKSVAELKDKNLNAKILNLESLANKSTLDMKDVKKLEQFSDEILEAVGQLKQSGVSGKEEALKDVEKLAKNLKNKASNEVKADKIENFWKETDTKGVALDASIGAAALFHHERIKGSENLRLAQLSARREEAIYNLKLAKNKPVTPQNQIKENLDKIVNQAINPRLFLSPTQQFEEGKNQILAYIKKEKDNFIGRNKEIYNAVIDQYNVDKEIMKKDPNLQKLSVRRGQEVGVLGKELRDFEAQMAKLETQAFDALHKKIFG